MRAQRKEERAATDATAPRPAEDGTRDGGRTTSPTGETTTATKTTREEPKATLDRGDSVTVVEALPEPYSRKGHLPGALLLPHDAVDALAPTLPPDKGAAIVV